MGLILIIPATLSAQFALESNYTFKVTEPRQCEKVYSYPIDTIWEIASNFIRHIDSELQKNKELDLLKTKIVEDKKSRLLLYTITKKNKLFGEYFISHSILMSSNGIEKTKVIYYAISYGYGLVGGSRACVPPLQELFFQEIENRLERQNK
jgi:hypothetical protein